MDGTTSQKINKQTEDLNDPINKLNLADVLSTLLPPAARHTLLKHTIWNILQAWWYAGPYS